MCVNGDRIQMKAFETRCCLLCCGGDFNFESVKKV